MHHASFMRLAALPLLAALSLLAPGCAGVLVVPPTVGFIAGVSTGPSASNKHDSSISHGLAGAAIGLVIDIALVVIVMSSNADVFSKD